MTNNPNQLKKTERINTTKTQESKANQNKQVKKKTTTHTKPTQFKPQQNNATQIRPKRPNQIG